MGAPLGRSEVVKVILGFLAKPNSVCFAGAGVGVRAGLPAWRKYLDKLAEVAEKYEPATAALMRQRIAAERYPDAAHYYKRCEMPVGVMFQELAAPFQEGTYDSAPVEPLVSLPFTTLVTTNYDRSLHNAWAGVHGKAPMTAELNDPTLRRAIHSRDPIIVRVHGRAEAPETMVVDTDDYAGLMSNRDYVDFLFHILGSQRCLFVGFSFVDPAIRAVLRVFEDTVGPTYPNEHVALVPEGAAALSSYLAQFNINRVQYEAPDGRHDELWRGIDGAARAASRSDLQPVLSTIPAALEGAKRLIVSSYVHKKMRREIAPLRDQIVAGMVIAAVTEAGSVGLTREGICQQMASQIALTREETDRLVEQAVARLLADKTCDQTDDRITCDVDDQALEEDMATLVEGILNRLSVREGLAAPKNADEIVRNVLDDMVLMRGWDLGAHFAGASVPPSATLWSVLDEAVARRAPGIAGHIAHALAAAGFDLLTRPDTAEAAILSDLGRLSYGVDVVLQHGRSALLHPHILPHRIYLDTSFVLPAIVNGHPSRPAYSEAIKRWIESASAAGLGPTLLVAEEFLEEIVAHRANAINVVEEQGLDRPERLSKHILLFGADFTNVFVGAYGSWVGRVPDNPPTFMEFLESNAPYASIPDLRKYLHGQGFSTVPLSTTANRAEQDDYDLMQQALRTAYDKDPRPESKPNVLIRHEARQLARLKRDLEGRQRAVFVSADNRLRRAAIGPVLGYPGAAIVSHLGFIQLIDLLVGMEPEPASLARLMWGIRFVDEIAAPGLTLRAYFTDRALQHYDAGMAMAMPQVLDRVVEEVSQAAADEQIALTGKIDQAAVAKFMDRFEDRFFQYMRDEIERRRGEQEH